MSWFAATAIVMLAACGGSASKPGTAPGLTGAARPSSPEDIALAGQLDAAVDKAIAEQNVVGTVVIIARDGQIIYHRAAGLADRESQRPVREDTIFRLASMTKLIVSVAALALVEQGKLRLDDPVSRWIPEFRPVLADGREPVITVRQLITHTSGLGYGFLEKPDGPYQKAQVSDGLAEPGMSIAENLRRLASVPLLFEPGARWHYGLSIDVLGEVIARAGGDSLPEIVRRLVSEPLGLRDTGFAIAPADRERLATPYAEGKPPVRMAEKHVLPLGGLSIRFAPSRIFDPRSFPSGGAGAAGTARDYLRFLEAIRTGGAPILRRETVLLITQNQIGSLGAGDDPSALGPGWGFGLGAGVIVDPAASKSPYNPGTWTWGGVYGTSFWVDPTARLSVVILTNSAADGTLGEAITNAVYATAAGK